MNNTFEDITDKLGEPTWYDEHGFPRYCEFHPSRTANIYGYFCVLLRISCQYCGKEFEVSITMDGIDMMRLRGEDINWHYGDPPNHGCTGDSMNSEPREILECWQNTLAEWKRLPEKEGKIKGAEK